MNPVKMSSPLNNYHRKFVFVYCIILNFCEPSRSISDNITVNLFEEDIIISSDHLSKHREEKSLVKDKRELWPNGILYYDYAPKEFNQYQKKIIERAMQDLEENSCIRFKKRNSNTVTYVYFRNIGSGCAAAVGYHSIKGALDLYLGGPKCHTHGTIQHELLHSLGFWHEHTRADRDQFIRIEWKNILRGRNSNFQKRNEGNVQTLGMPYDYGSVLHYRPTAFSRDGTSPTIVPLDPNAYRMMGQRIRFSTVDIAKLNRLYNCPKYRYYVGEDIINKRSIIGEVQLKY